MVTGSVPGVVPGCDLSLDVVNNEVAKRLGVLFFSPWKHNSCIDLTS